MREVKFRVWDKFSKRMGHVDRIHLDDKELSYITKSKDVVVYRDYKNECVLMQYTGLKDKNDKEIYEGDIVEYEDEVNGVWAEYFGIPIIYSNEYAMFCFKDDEGNLLNIYRNLKVIGNIYEDKELLEEVANE